MAKYSTFEQLPVEIVELCLEGLPASSIAALLGLSRQTRHLVLTSIEFIFAKMVKSFEDKSQYIGLEAIHSSLSVTVRSSLTFQNFIPIGHVSTVPKAPLRYARFVIESPMDVAGGESDAALFTCSVFRKDSDIPCRNFFEDICKVRDQDPIVVDRDGLLVNIEPPQEGQKPAEKSGKVVLKTVDINPLKVISLELASKLLAKVACQGLRV
ncbi:hypothetical protein PGT21_013641 [Puccinia graminis f. sp. tritici]|uniref:F-box domain-containing protein n=1 Tax=Puccinia graminis f. sp. tritici TaxID=56615 RepID=A0A5B0QF40_PUCGR|nr:hypothetical protein PGT21_013641 [Puccinia graminis f. sp. tritici]